MYHNSAQVSYRGMMPFLCDSWALVHYKGIWPTVEKVCIVIPAVIWRLSRSISKSWLF